MNIKEISKADRNHINAVFNTLYTAFSEWHSYHNDPWELLQFANYEGVGGCFIENLLTYAAPFAVGNYLNKQCDFHWCKLDDNDCEQWGIVHSLLDEPISFDTLLEGKWNREDYDEPESSWIIVIDSVHYIKLVLRWKKLYDNTKPLPDLTTDELELELNRREAIH